MNENKIKTYCFGSLFTFVLAFVVLYCLPLVSHASTNQIPAPYGFGSGYGYREWTGSNPIPTILDYFEENNIDVYGILMYEQASDNSYLDFYICKEDFIYVGSGENGTSWNLYYGLDLRDTSLSGVSADLYRIDSNGNITLRNTNYDLSPTCSFPDGGVISSGVAYVYYPLWYPDNGAIKLRRSFNDATYYDGFVFEGEIPPVVDYDGLGFGDLSGTITPSSGVDSPGFDIDFDVFIDMNPLKILGEEIRDGIGSLVEKVEDGFTTVIGAIGDTFTMLQNNTQTLVSKVGEIVDDLKKPSSQQLQDTLDNSTVVGGVVDIAQEGKTFLDSLTASGIQVPTAQDMDFDYPFTWKEYVPALHAFHTHTTTVHISFSWYESIRDKVLLVIGVFMTIGFTVYLIKQIPNLIAGVSGGASAGQSIADHVTNNKGGKK